MNAGRGLEHRCRNFRQVGVFGSYGYGAGYGTYGSVIRHYFGYYVHCAQAHDVEGAGGYFGQIQNALVAERAAVGYPHDYRFARTGVGYAQLGAKRQGFVGTGILVSIEPLAVAGAKALVLTAIPRGAAA
jgi:hypothetical protein